MKMEVIYPPDQQSFMAKQSSKEAIHQTVVQVRIEPSQKLISTFSIIFVWGSSNESFITYPLSSNLNKTTIV